MKLAVISNFVIRSFFLFLIFYLWGTFFLSGFFMIFLVSFLLTCVVNYAWFFFAIKRKKKKTLTLAEQEHADKVLLQLEFMTTAQSLVLFYGALKKKFLIHRRDLGEVPALSGATGESACVSLAEYYSSGSTSGSRSKAEESKVASLRSHQAVQPIIEIMPDKIFLKTEEHNAYIFSLFHKDVTKQDVVNCIALTKVGAKTVIFAKSFPLELRMFFERLNCAPVFLDGESVYTTLLKPTQTYPQFNIEVKKSARMTLRQLRQLMFQRRRAKGYIFIGILILVTSLIVRPSIYYIILATIVFGLAVASYFRPSKTQDVLW